MRPVLLLVIRKSKVRTSCKSIFLLLLISGSLFAQDTIKTTTSGSQRFLLFYPAGYLLNLGINSRLMNAAFGFENFGGDKWATLVEVNYRRIALFNDGSSKDLPGDMFAIKGGGRYYTSGSEGWFFIEPALAFCHIPQGFPGSDAGASDSEKDKALVQTFFSAGIGIGIRTGNHGNSKWSFTLGCHMYFPFWTRMTGEAMEKDWENDFMDFLGPIILDQMIPYRTREAYVGFGYHF